MAGKRTTIRQARAEGYLQGLHEAQEAIVEATKRLAEGSLSEETYRGLSEAYEAVLGLDDSEREDTQVS